jgi:hypothetical protein
MAENSGAQRAIGSSSVRRPSSSSMSAATDVIGFDIEPMRKSVSRSTGSRASTSRHPTHDVVTVSAFQTRAAAPASSPASTVGSIAFRIASCCVITVSHALTEGLMFQRFLTPELLPDEVFRAAFQALSAIHLRH